MGVLAGVLAFVEDHSNARATANQIRDLASLLGASPVDTEGVRRWFAAVYPPRPELPRQAD